MTGPASFFVGISDSLQKTTISGSNCTFSMNTLKELNLPASGLIVFGARPGMGLTTVTLCIAAQLAQNKRVVFVSYQSYREKLIRALYGSSNEGNDRLQFDTSLPYHSLEFQYHLQTLINNTKANTVVIDDLDSMLGDDDLGPTDRNRLIEQLSVIAQESKARIVLNVCPSNNVDLAQGDKRPMLRHFNWSRNLAEVADQIYSIYRPEYYGILQDENGKPTLGKIEIDLIKDRNCKETTFIMYSNA